MKFPFSIFGRKTTPGVGGFEVDPGALAIIKPLEGLFALRRTEDMAELLLEFDNARLVTTGQGAARVRPASAGAVYMTAWFRPQHAEEQARKETVPISTLPQGRMSGWSRIVVRRPSDAPDLPFTAPDILRALETWPLVLPLNGQPTGEPAPPKPPTPIEAAMAAQPGISASAAALIVGDLKAASASAGQRFTRDLPGLAAGTVPRNLKNAARKASDRALKKIARPSPELRQAAETAFLDGLTVVMPFVPIQLAGKPKPPERGETALELPSRLYLSPTLADRIRHRATPFQVNGRTELWHTRLSRKTSAAVEGEEEAARDPATVRAIWSPDAIDNEAPPHFIFPIYSDWPTGFIQENGAVWALAGQDRSDIVHLSANYDTVRQGDGTPWTPLPAKVKRLELSALGGFLDLDANWPGPLPVGVSTTAWRHRLSLGRDSRVEVVKAGVLAPFGHQAVRIIVTEREIEGLTPDLSGDIWTGKDIAILVQREYLAVVEPVKAFAPDHLPFDGREFPFAKVEILTGQTEIKPLTSGDWPSAVHDSDLLNFDVRATDRAGREVRFRMPMMFFEIAQATPAGAGPGLVAQYGYGPLSDRHTVDLQGQTLRFADDPAADSLSLSAENLSFDIADWTTSLAGGIHRFRPRLAQAKVDLPGAPEFVGGPQKVDVVFYDGFRQHGFSDQNKGEVTLALQQPLALFTSSSGASSEKAGPIATPRVAVHGLSRRLGAVTGAANAGADAVGQASEALSQVSAGTLDPATLLPDMKLLGAFDFKSLLEDQLGLPSGIDEVVGDAMKLKRDIQSDGSVTASLIFRQKLKAVSIPPDSSPALSFQPNGAELNIRAVATIPVGGGQAAQTLDASVGKFAINFFDAVELHFEQLAFRIVPGQKPDFDLNFGAGNPLKFIGKLSFLQQLAEVLPVSAFSDPPDLQITSSGVVAGYNLGLPPIQVGALALSNIGFGARFELPFLGGAPSLRLNFAERHSPFGILVACLGGGGFVAVEFDTRGLKSIEGTLEAQAGIAINLGVAAGAVMARLGIYYRWDVQVAGGTMTLEAFAEIRGEMSVLGLISVSITFHVGLEFKIEGDQKLLMGRASITVEIELLFFSKSVSVECERKFLGCNGDPTFDEVFDDIAYGNYVSAFE